MGFNFPNSPALNDTYAPVGGPVFTWDGVAWKGTSQGAPVSVYVSDTAPLSPAIGQLWWNSATGTMAIWYADADSAQWVQVSGESSSNGPGFIQQQIILASGPITLHADTKVFLVEVQGGGAGGGASGATASTTVAAGGGGGGGGYCSRWVMRPSGIYVPTCTIAAGGGGGVNGGSSAFSDGTYTMTAGGGVAGSPGTQTANAFFVPGGNGGSATGGTVNVPGQNGLSSIEMGAGTMSGTLVSGVSGAGGNSRFGAGGPAYMASGSGAIGATGNSGTGYGSGGSGGVLGNSGGSYGGWRRNAGYNYNFGVPLMGLNFPNSPSQGQVFTSTTGLQYVYLDGVWRIVEAPQDIGKAEARNRIVNGAMQISQENPKNFGIPITSGGNDFPADQWQTSHVSAASAFNTACVNSIVNPDAIWRIRMNVGATADAAIAAGDYARFYQSIEGIRVADFAWGTASAKQVVLRFTARSTVAGTFCVALRNGAALNRSYVKNCTLAAANTDQEFTLVIPGDTTGTWAVDNTHGMTLLISTAAGTTFQGVEGWQAGNIMATSAISNFLGTANATFDITKVGLYLDPLNTGIAPPWQMPDEAEELRACQRYWQFVQLDMVSWATAGGTFHGSTYPFPVVFRVAPAAATISAGTATNVSAAIIDSITVRTARQYIQSAAAGTFAIAGRVFSLSARM